VANGFRFTQQHPTPERYREIQQALADQGFYNGPVDGNWTAESLAALRRYQQEKSLPGDGRLNSLTLISLGLGPKRTPPEEPSKPAPIPQAEIP
jgi:peptidoglycan hydrolase-like protein with peptidoglycan-binding domain